MAKAKKPVRKPVVKKAVPKLVKKVAKAVGGKVKGKVIISPLPTVEPPREARKSVDVAKIIQDEAKKAGGVAIPAGPVAVMDSYVLPNSAPPPAKQEFIRPPWETIRAGMPETGFIKCRCGETVQDLVAISAHYRDGHYDYPKEG